VTATGEKPRGLIVAPVQIAGKTSARWEWQAIPGRRHFGATPRALWANRSPINFHVKMLAIADWGRDDRIENISNSNRRFDCPAMTM
jgi:hypothetical protein